MTTSVAGRGRPARLSRYEFKGFLSPVASGDSGPSRPGDSLLGGALGGSEHAFAKCPGCLHLKQITGLGYRHT